MLSVVLQIEKLLLKKIDPSASRVNIDNQIFQTIKIQFQALSLVRVTYSKSTSGTMALFWSLTDEARALMMSLRTIKSGR
jgi:hypothetical protein